MSTRAAGILLILGVMACALPVRPALAQSFGFFNSENETPEPPQGLPPLPEGAQAQVVANPETQPQPQQNIPMNAYDYARQQQRTFPALPPSRQCTATDVVGIWKLIDVYEDPEGAETQAFKSSPYQYMMFKSDSVYAKNTSSPTELSAAMARMEMEKQSKALHQYLVNESGVIFFYNQGVAVDSLACFIVANERGSFAVGQMILMPPKGQQSTRLAKVYSRHVAAEPRLPQARANEAAGGGTPATAKQPPSNAAGNAATPSGSQQRALPAGRAPADRERMRACFHDPVCRERMRARMGESGRQQPVGRR